MKRSHQHIHPLLTATGFSYVEVLIATAVLAVSLVPAMEALRSSTTLLAIQETMSIDRYSLLSKTEEVLKESFTALDAASVAAGSPTTPTSYSDNVETLDGRQLTRNVYIWPMDGDNADFDLDPFTGTDQGILYVKVAISQTDLFYETIATKQ